MSLLPREGSDPFAFSDSVSCNGDKDRADVIKAQTLLANAGHYDLLVPGVPTGWPGGELERARQVGYRLLGKFCTNRNQVTFSMPDRKVQYTQEKGSMFWFGHDAIRWANEDPRRYLHYNAEAWALRPMDPQHPPQTGAAI